MSEVEFLREILSKLINAEVRRGTSQDGDWGWPSFREEMQELAKALKENESKNKGALK